MADSQLSPTMADPPLSFGRKLPLLVFNFSLVTALTFTLVYSLLGGMATIGMATAYFTLVASILRIRTPSRNMFYTGAIFFILIPSITTFFFVASYAIIVAL